MDTFYYITGQCVGANEVSEFPAVGLQDGMTVALPQKFSFRYETDLVSYLKDGVHVVCIDHRGHVELLCQVADEAVDKN